MIVRIINKASVRTERKFFEKIARLALQKGKHKDKAEIFLILTSDSEIKKLNKKYRRKNRITDVLAFPNFPVKERSFIMPKGADHYLGEVVISLPQAKRQAKEYGCSLKSELMRLFTHGLLHLLGYDHVQPRERAIMERLENEIIQKYNH